jgi:hypothetical protein
MDKSVPIPHHNVTPSAQVRKRLMSSGLYPEWRPRQAPAIMLCHLYCFHLRAGFIGSGKKYARSRGARLIKAGVSASPLDRVGVSDRGRFFFSF